MNGALLLAGVTAIATIAIGQPAAAQADPAGRPTVGTTAAGSTPAPAPPPLPGATPGDRAGGPRAAAALQHFSAQGSQIAVSNGAHATFDIGKPTLSTSDSYSLAALAVSSADRRQIIHVGWIVSRALNRDDQPHLYVHHYVDGKPVCYNTCGFVLTDTSAGAPGTKLAAGAVRRLAIRHYDGDWWISVSPPDVPTVWMGYFPDSLWGGRFTQAGVQQWYGQVAANTATPCTDMGNGLFGTATSGSRITDIRLFDSAAAPNVATGHSHPAYYTAAKISDTELRFGGPGAC
ncbi:MAG TPA: neprosin family prolyl endopeptidase [Catenuloplanes sp.]